MIFRRRGGALVAFAVSVFFDERTDTIVRQAWTRMTETGISCLLSDGPYRPHLTLAIYAELDVDAFTPALAALARSQEAFAIALSYPGVFTGEEIAVFFAATVSQTLLALHLRVHRLLAQCGTGPSPYYLPDRWNPHCSVARRIEAGLIPQAVTNCLDAPLPLRGLIESVGIIQTPAERELHLSPFGSR